MIKPKALKRGDTVGVLAPSSPTAEKKVKDAKEQLEALGFQVQLAPSCHSKHGYLAGTDELRAEDINEMFREQRIDGIFCLRGGYGAPKILNRINFDIVKDNPKVFIGYSDITALHLAFNQICGLVTFHGPMAASDIAGGLDDYTKGELIRGIMNTEPMGLIKNPEGEKIHCIVGGAAEGPIVGGNLALVAATMGTPYEVDTRGKILFLEDIGEEPYRVDRMLTQLALAGKFEEVNGILLGDWNNCDPEKPHESLSLLEVFQEIIVPYNKPTIYNLKAGHCTPKATLPFGVRASMKAEEGILIIEESATVS